MEQPLICSPIGEHTESFQCPECGSERAFCNGHRTLRDGSDAQRYLCRKCGYRFSDASNLKGVLDNRGSSRQNNSSRGLVLATLEAEKTSVGELDQTQHGLIVDFQWRMKKRQKSDATIANRTSLLKKLVKLGADLQNPSSVETILATESYTVSMKHETVKTYVAFCKAFKIEWEPIKIQYEPKDIFLPTEQEIDQLIAACGKVTSTYLQVLKDTAARANEVRWLQWVDIDTVKNTIAINKPGKGSNSRTVRVSDKTIAALNSLPKNHSDYVFAPSIARQSVFRRVRKKLAVRMANPRLLKIHYHTLRHWKATMTYAKTREIYEVKKILGHKSLKNTDRYQHMIDFADEEYLVRRPKTSQDEDELIKQKWEFLRYDQKEDCPIYRKRK